MLAPFHVIDLSVIVLSAEGLELADYVAVVVAVVQLPLFYLSFSVPVHFHLIDLSVTR